MYMFPEEELVRLWIVGKVSKVETTEKGALLRVDERTEFVSWRIVGIVFRKLGKSPSELREFIVSQFEAPTPVELAFAWPIVGTIATAIGTAVAGYFGYKASGAQAEAAKAQAEAALTQQKIAEEQETTKRMMLLAAVGIVVVLMVVLKKSEKSPGASSPRE